MITAARLRQCPADQAALELFRELGYPINPVDLSPDEWRRAGVEVPWNGQTVFQLAARARRFDLFLLLGAGVEEGEIARFLRSYGQYNLCTKSVLIHQQGGAERLAVYDLSRRRELRRLDVDLRTPSTHALDRLNLLAAGGVDSLALPRIYDRALDREGIGRRFFERFRDAVQDVSAALVDSCPKEMTRDRDAQALLVLSRLLFLSFVQEKGWLNGERRFLIDRFDQARREGRPLFAGVLAPLFFGCLNTPRHAREGFSLALGAIPYLNGGLFEPSPFERRNGAIDLPDELLQQVMEEVFEKFDFSVDESDGVGTHVDPEMLGKVFESLMAEDERANSGSFYTPRPIVDVLTTRAITEWLADGDQALRGVLVSACRGGALELHGQRLEAVRSRLQSLTFLDPACGSGAFLLSALGVIERLTLALSRAAGVPPPAELRQAIIERSLFGVDLKVEAVRLCELRLWLAIVSSSEASIDQVRPLPNLDRNILQGNSLLSPTDFLGDGRAAIYREWVYALRARGDLMARYRAATRDERPALTRLLRENDRLLASELLSKAVDADEEELRALTVPQRDLFGRTCPTDGDRSRQLQARIAENRCTLERIEEGAVGFFSFDIHFAQVLSAGGFDVVAGNPPWVRNSRIDLRSKRMYAERYRLFRAEGGKAPGDGAFHQPDLSVAFFERALGLTRRGGVVSMLMPAKIVNAGYAAPLRRHVHRYVRIVELADWSDDARRLFDADTFPLGMTVVNAPPPRAARSVTVDIVQGSESFRVRPPDLLLDPAQSEWALVPPRVRAILANIRSRHRNLSEVLKRRPLMGVKTGDNRAFFLEGERIVRGHLVTCEGIAVPLSAVCRCVRGRDVHRWSATDSQWMLWPPTGGWKKPPRWLCRLAEVRGVAPEDFRLQYVMPEHAGIKVVWKDVARGMCATVLPGTTLVNGHELPLIPNQTLYTLDAGSLDEAYALAALLNSAVADALLLCVVERAKDAHFRYFARTVGRMPLPRLAPGDLVRKLVRLSRRAHQGAAVTEEVDRLVAAVYGV
ncbi:MAG: hypothetical protein JWO56_1904, partial [Acidobacteria bacterium]|nr:hypothetical protein [Acidobacteriota bacterium]